MCFRPSALSQNDSKSQGTITCQTCGMSVSSNPNETGGFCPYCGDPIPSDPPEDFSEIDPSFSSRVI